MIQSPGGGSAHPVDHGEGMGWIFVTHAFWGENPQGDWSLTVADGLAEETGDWEAFGWRVRMGRLEES